MSYKLNKTNILSAKISREFNSNPLIIDTSRPSRDPMSFFQIPTSMAESLLRVIVLPSLVCPYSELDIEHYEIRKE